MLNRDSGTRYTRFSSVASATQKIEFPAIQKRRLGKKPDEYDNDITHYNFISSASGYHYTKHSDKYDSVKKQSTGHLKDF